MAFNAEIQHKKMPSFSGVAAGQEALAKLPMGMTYHELVISYEGMDLAHVKQIRVKANNTVIFRMSGTMLNVLNKYDGRPVAPTTGAGQLILPFTRHGLRDRALQDETAIVTGKPIRNANGDIVGAGVQALHVEVDIADAATAPVLKLTANVSSMNTAAALFLHRKVVYRNAAGAGELQISDLPWQTPDVGMINRAVFASEKIEELRIERDQRVVFERDVKTNDLLQKDGGKTPQAGYFIVDTNERGNGRQMIEAGGAQDFRYFLEMSAAAQIPIIIETVGTLGNGG